MKIIDENGRIFGKINIIDFMALLFLTCLLYFSYFGYKLYSYTPVKEAREKIFLEKEFDCKFVLLSPNVAKMLLVGDKEMNKDGDTLAQVTWTGKITPYEYNVMIESGETELITDAYLKELPAKIKIKMEEDDSGVYYNGQKISPGKIFNFKTSKYSTRFMLVKEKNEKWFTIKVRFAATSPEIGNLITSGHIEKDAKGRIICKLVEILSKSPSRVSALKLEESKFVFIDDPFRNDIIAVLEVLGREREGEWYFKNYQLKIGNQVMFSSELYAISGEIIGISNTPYAK